MTYNPTTWKRGDIVTSEKLNNIESGIVEASVMPVITFTMDYEANVITCDKTYEELKAITTVLPNGPVETACVVNAQWVNLPSLPNLPTEFTEQHVGALWFMPYDDFSLQEEAIYIYCTWMHHETTDAPKQIVKELDFIYPPEDSEDGIFLTQRRSSISITTTEENTFPTDDAG